MNVKYASSKSGLAILRCSRVGAEVVRAAVTLICEIEATVAITATAREIMGRAAEQKVLPTRLTVVGVSGTIKKLQLQAIRIDRRIIQEEQAKLKRKIKAQGRKNAARCKKAAQGPEPSRTSAVGITQWGSVPAQGPERSPLPTSVEPGSATLDGFDDDDEDLGFAI